MTQVLNSQLRLGKTLILTCLFTSAAVSFLIWWLGNNVYGDFSGAINYKLIKTGVGPWAKYQPLLAVYEKQFDDVGYHDRLPLLKVARSITRPLEEIIENSAELYEVNPVLLKVLMAKESSSGKNPAIRFEQQWMEHARKLSDDPAEQRMWSSSHGPMQIAGWWVKEIKRTNLKLKPKGNDWVDLYDLNYNIELGAAIFKNCLGRNARLPRHKQIWQAFRCYNGSGEQATLYANDAYRRLSDMLIGQM